MNLFAISSSTNSYSAWSLLAITPRKSSDQSSLRALRVARLRRVFQPRCCDDVMTVITLLGRAAAALLALLALSLLAAAFFELTRRSSCSEKTRRRLSSSLLPAGESAELAWWRP
jgi:hypothetical protein